MLYKPNCSKDLNKGGCVEIGEFFLEQYDTVRGIVNDLFIKGLTDEQRVAGLGRPFRVSAK